jgi:hypothetical protein
MTPLTTSATPTAMDVKTRSTMNNSIQALFVPTTRYQDLHRIRSREVRSEHEGRGDTLPVLPDDWQEVEFHENFSNANCLPQHQQQQEQVQQHQQQQQQDVGMKIHTTWDELLSFASDYHAVWMTPFVFITVRQLPCVYLSDYPHVLSLQKDNDSDSASDDCTDGKQQLPAQSQNQHVHIMAASRSQAMSTSDFLLRLLARSEPTSVVVTGRRRVLPISAETLSYFLTRTSNYLERLLFDSVALTPEHCQILTTTNSTTTPACTPSQRLQIRLAFCPVFDRTSTAFIAWLRSATGPVGMAHCPMDAQVLADALVLVSSSPSSSDCTHADNNSNNNNNDSSTTRLTELVHSAPYSSAGLALVVRALALNNGLQSLTLHQEMSDKNWTLLCESVIQPKSNTNANSTTRIQSLLHTLDCRGNGQRVLRGKTAAMSEERIARRMRVLAAAMRDNTVLQHLYLSSQVVDDILYPGTIVPRVQANLYRTRFLRVQQQVDDSTDTGSGTASKQMRAKVLLAALQSVRTDPHLVWMLLSENRDVAFAACCNTIPEVVAAGSMSDNDNDTTMMLMTTTTTNSNDNVALDTSKRKREYD